MKIKKTISLPEDLSQLVEREAERCGLSVSELVRISLKQMLRCEEPVRFRGQGWSANPK